jgi:hypothetical protein
MYHHINLLLMLSCYGMIIYGIIEKDINTKTICIVVGIASIFIYPCITELLLNIKAKLFSNFSIKSHIEKHDKIFGLKLPIIYSDDYNITACGLEKCHPFDSCKYRGGKLLFKYSL